ncbi:hypothetical protein BDW22DRAFT_1358220 [Trametopsis cervina]|nr:hypothetical protein BDW22DRAFT_1358220 [Trametopsis cervina]
MSPPSSSPDISSPPSLPPSLYDAPSQDIPTKHYRFYLEDRMAVFRVENTLFKVHRHFLSQGSELFESMFSLPVGNDNTAQEEIIPLPDVRVAEFEALLTFFYRRDPNLPADLKFWSDLLSISTRFFFDAIREQAVQKLAELLRGNRNPVEKIYLASKFDIASWKREAYCALCEREDPLELWEATRIGWETAILLVKAREVLRDNRSHPASPEPSSPRPTPSAPQPVAWLFGPEPRYTKGRVSWAITKVFGEIKS